MRKILFVCVANAGRSQMAAAFANLYGEGRVVASSGGTNPAEEVHPVVVEAMRERGIDISQNKPRRISTANLEEADQVIVMGCGAEGFCPATLLKKVEDWALDDPKGQPLERVREIRDEIEERVKELIATQLLDSFDRTSG
ncbi:MAG: arsenate reductase ArsC [Promethearchaeota archaeon]